MTACGDAVSRGHTSVLRPCYHAYRVRVDVGPDVERLLRGREVVVAEPQVAGAVAGDLERGQRILRRRAAAHGRALDLIELDRRTVGVGRAKREVRQD